MSEVALYVGLVAVVIAAVPTMFWLKREGDREWRRHQRRVADIRLIVNIAKVTAAIGAISAVMPRALAAAAEYERVMAGVGATIHGHKPVNPKSAIEGDRDV